MMTLSCASADELFHRANSYCMQAGEKSDSIGREVLGFCGRLTNPMNNVVWNERRGFAPSYGAAVLMDLLRQNRGELSTIVRLALRNAVDRKLGSSLVWEDGEASYQFIQQGNFLNLIVSMQVSDSWVQFPNDLFCFTMLQRLIAAELDLGLGFYQHQVGAMQLYTGYHDAAGEALKLAPVDGWVVFAESGEQGLFRQLETALVFNQAFAITPGGNAEFNLMSLESQMGHTPLAGLVALAAVRCMNEPSGEEFTALDNLCPRNLLTRALMQNSRTGSEAECLTSMGTK